MARGKRPDPFRTRKLSLPAPMVLPRRRGGRVGRRRTTIPERAPAPLGPLRRLHGVYRDEKGTCAAGACRPVRTATADPCTETRVPGGGQPMAAHEETARWGPPRAAVHRSVSEALRRPR